MCVYAAAEKWTVEKGEQKRKYARTHMDDEERSCAVEESDEELRLPTEKADTHMHIFDANAAVAGSKSTNYTRN